MYEECLRLFAERGASLDSEDRAGKTPIQLAMENSLYKTASFIQKKLVKKKLIKLQSLIDSSTQYLSSEQITRVKKQIEEQLEQLKPESQQIAIELNAVKVRLNEIENKQDPLFREYALKQAKLEEQQSLQNPLTLRTFYNKIELDLGAKLVSAFLLVGGKLQRSGTLLDEGVALAATSAETLVAGFPLLSAGAPFLGLAVEKGGGALIDRKQMRKCKNIVKTFPRLEDLLEFKELVARRIAQHFSQHMEERSISDEEAKKAGEKVANVIWDTIKKGGAEHLAQKSLEERVQFLVDKIKAEAGRKFFKNFAAPSSPLAAQHQIVVVTQDVQNLTDRVDLTDRTSQRRIDALTIDNQQLRQDMDQLKRDNQQLRAEFEQLKRLV